MVNWFTDPAWDRVKIKLKLTVRGLKQSVAAPESTHGPVCGAAAGLPSRALGASGSVRGGDARATPPRGCMHG